MIAETEEYDTSEMSDKKLVYAAMRLSETKIWDNPEDAAYDNL